jgi:hypothetical protein
MNIVDHNSIPIRTCTCTFSSNNGENLTEHLELNHLSFEKSLEITYLEQYWKNGRNRYPANRMNATVAIPEQRGIAGHNNKNMI